MWRTFLTLCLIVVGAVETVNGVDYQLVAEVGLLTRNVKVIGDAHNKLMEELFGARVIVGEMMSEEGATYTGYARLSDVEFYHGGQEGYTEFYDPRHTLAFLDVGEVSSLRPSSVKKCTFHHNFSPAIGIYGTSGLRVENNVVYHTIGAGNYNKDKGTPGNRDTFKMAKAFWNLGQGKDLLEFGAMESSIV